MGKFTALLDDSRREDLIADIVDVVEDHIAQRPGLRGVALRAAMGAVNRRLPDAIPRSVARLLPDFTAALEPLHARSRGAGGVEFARILKRDRAQVAEAVLAIADARVAASSNGALKAFYARFRGIAEHEAEALVPALADVLARHL
ncbi:MAG: DUF6918 family protein [Gammaproteobacteria bacterium]